MRGGQWQALRLHGALIESGHQSLLLAHRDSPLLRIAREQDLDCEILNTLRLRSLARGFDAVHAHDSRSHTLAALFSKAPVVVSRRVSFPVGSRPVPAWKYARATLFIAVSEYVAALLRAARVNPNRIAVVHDGVPVAPQPSTGSEILIWRNPDSPSLAQLAVEAAAAAGVAARLSDDLAADLPRAWPSFIPRATKALGSGILLAMGHGVPVAASEVGGVPEIIRDGENGILVRDDLDSFTLAFKRISALRGACSAPKRARQF